MFAFTSRRSRGSPGAPTSSANGDVAALYIGEAYDGTNYQEAGHVAFGVDGTVAAGTVPGKYSVFTSDSAGIPQERMVVNSSGKVGIGTATPGEKLEVSGNIKGTGQIYDVSKDNGAGTAIDWNNGNIQKTTFNCDGATQFSFSNMQDGGSYTLIVIPGAPTGSCKFTDGGDTFQIAPANAAPIASAPAIYTMVKIGTSVYISWINGNSWAAP